MKTIVGSCPQCGAPIYVPTIWHGIVPPPPEFTCACRPTRTRIVTTTTTSWLPEFRRPAVGTDPEEVAMLPLAAFGPDRRAS